MQKLLLILACLPLILSSCIKYSPYEIRLSNDEKDLNNKNISKILNIPAKDTLVFVFAGDAQRFYDEAIPLVDKINTDPTIDFVAFAGDFTDFGLAQEFQGMNSIIKNLQVPYVAVLGNHDMLYNGGEVYRQMFGVYDFTFQIHGFRFVFANTNSREFGFSGKVPNIAWLNSQLADTANYFGAIVVVHVPPGNDDFDNALEQDFALALSQPGKTIMELNGHNHDFADSYPYYGNVRYLNSFSLNNRKYLKIKLWRGNNPENSHNYQIISF
jgi:3',5'-cyclic-AMP phosphodiesterase